MKWIRTCQARGEPFFAYIATNAPHGPLFVPDRYRAPYRHLPRNVASFFGMIANIDENLGKLEAMLGGAWPARGHDPGLPDRQRRHGGRAGLQRRHAGAEDRPVRRRPSRPLLPPLARGRTAAPRRRRRADRLPGPAPDPDRAVRAGAARRGPVRRAQPGEAAPRRGRSTRRAAWSWSSSAGWTPPSRSGAMPPSSGVAGGWSRRTSCTTSRADPGQTTDVAAQHPEVVERMRAHYARWWARAAPRVERVQPDPRGFGRGGPRPAVGLRLAGRLPGPVAAGPPGAGEERRLGRGGRACGHVRDRAAALARGGGLCRSAPRPPSTGARTGPIRRAWPCRSPGRGSVSAVSTGLGRWGRRTGR